MTIPIYMAGPEVFVPNGLAIVARKNELCRQYGFATVRPQADWDRSAFPKYELGLEISRRNEALMDEAKLVIANLTPFRGISADVGTVYELGYMIAQGKPAFAFSNDARGYFERARDDFYRGAVAVAADGRQRGDDGHRVEDHEMADNLMLDGGILRRGGTFVRRAVAPEKLFEDLTAFEECLKAARAALG